LKKIAVTGSLSSGKTTVCQFLTELGAYVVSADEIVHHLLESDAEIKKKVVHALGEDILVQGQLNREAIAQKVFSTPIQLHFLEQLLHPKVQHEIQTKYEAVKNNPKYTFFVAEVPLLYETAMESLFDFVIVVIAKEAECKKRFFAKKQRNDVLFTERMARQIPSQEKANKAHFTLINNTSLLNLKNEVTKLVHQL
jgi:dephospho-CoA kinase